MGNLRNEDRADRSGVEWGAKGLLVALVLAGLVSALVPQGMVLAQSSSAEHKRDVDDWFGKRVQRLRSKTGYLSLVGLYELKEGKNSFGSAHDNNLVTPEGTPEHCGFFSLKGDLVGVDIAVDAGFKTVQGKDVRAMVLKTDKDENGPDVIVHESFRFYVIVRGDKHYVRVQDEESPAIKKFDSGKLVRYPVREKWKVEARFEEYDPPELLSFMNVLGLTEIATCPGRLVFEIDGEAYSLEPTVEMTGRGEEFFIVFGDETNALETYGGGRYLYTSMPDDRGIVDLDFNKAYNPPCVFSNYTTCTLPTRENRLPLRVTAGEKLYAKGP